MATSISPVRTAFMYRRGARMFWTSKMGPLKPGLQCGYAVTAFNTEPELRSVVRHYKYSELFANLRWKVGTAVFSEVRLKELFKKQAAPLREFEDVWERYFDPLKHRLGTYATNTKNYVADNDEFQKDVLTKTFAATGNVAILMVPLIIAYKGTDNDLEREMSRMIVNHGGEVWNNKDEQEQKKRKDSTRVAMNLEDINPDKLLKLTPTLQKLGFELHPSYRRARK